MRSFFVNVVSLTLLLGCSVLPATAQHNHGIVIVNEADDHVEVEIYDEHGHPIGGGEGAWHIDAHKRKRLNDGWGQPVRGEEHHKVRVSGKTYGIQQIGDLEGEDWVIHVHEDMLHGHSD